MWIFLKIKIFFYKQIVSKNIEIYLNKFSEKRVEKRAQMRSLSSDKSDDGDETQSSLFI